MKNNPSSKAKVLTGPELTYLLAAFHDGALTDGEFTLRLIATVGALKAELAQKTKAYHEASEQGIAAVSQMERNAVERDALRAELAREKDAKSKFAQNSEHWFNEATRLKAELALKDKVVEAAREFVIGWERFEDDMTKINFALNDLDKVMAR